MKSKILSLFLLTAIFSIVMISAAVTFTVTQPATFKDNLTSTTFTINNTGNETATFTIPSTIQIENVPITLDSYTFTLAPGDTPKLITASVDSAKLDELTTNNYEKSVTITATNATTSNTLNQTITFKIEKPYCSNNNIGKLKVDKVGFSNNGLGKDTEWYMLDEIEVEVRVENTGAEDIDNVIVEWALYDKKNGDIILDNEENDFDIKDGDKETITFTITIDPDDFDAGYSEGDFVFLVKAYSDDTGEDVDCNWVSKSITINKDGHYVILNNLNVPETISCGIDTEITAEAWNIGDDDEQDVYVTVYNKELGINEKIIVGDVDVLESKKISFNLKIPANTAEKTYGLDFNVIDEDDDIFQNDDDDESIYTKIFKVAGNCVATTTSNVLITAELDSTTPEAIPGKQVIVKATVKNTGTSTLTSILSISGNSAWSSLKSIDPQTLTLNAGESKTVNILLNIDADAEGEKEFTITSTSGDKITEQKVALSLTKSNATSSIIANHLKANWFIYVIVLVNIILIITIIAVVKSMVGRGNSL